jgi:hypothetical protein
VVNITPGPPLLPCRTYPVKGKVHPRTGREGQDGELKYSSTLSLTSALDGGQLSTPRPCRFTPGKAIQYPLCRRMGGPPNRSALVGKISPPPEFDPLSVQLVFSRYKDYVVPANEHPQYPLQASQELSIFTELEGLFLS